MIEHLDLGLAVAPDRIVRRERRDELADARSELEGEMGSGRADEGLDVVDRRVGHRVAKTND